MFMSYDEAAVYFNTPNMDYWEALIQADESIDYVCGGIVIKSWGRPASPF